MYFNERTAKYLMAVICVTDIFSITVASRSNAFVRYARVSRETVVHHDGKIADIAA